MLIADKINLFKVHSLKLKKIAIFKKLSILK